MTTVTVNTRLARRLRRDFDQEREMSATDLWETPDILPWRAWIARLWEETIYSGRERRVLLSSTQERVLWEQIISTSAEGVDLLNPAGTAKMAAEAWRLLHAWRLPRLPLFFADVPDTEAFFEWSEAFEKTLLRRGFITEAEVPDLLLKHGFLRPAAFAGFDELTPVQRVMFEGAEEIPTPVPVLRSHRRAGLADAEQEMRGAARWTRNQLERNPAVSIGVIFPDLPARRTSASRIFEEILGTPEAFHISAPVPLGKVPMIADALLALRLSSGLTSAEAGRLLRSPYFPHTAQEGARTDIALRRRGVARVTLSNGEMKRLFPRLSQMDGPMRPSQWSAAFSRAALEAGWPGRRALSSEEYQALESWKGLLSEFSKFDAVLSDLEFGAALSQLEKLAEDTGFGLEDEDEPVQVMGVLEAAGARFDALWIGGLHDGAWPPPARPNPFLPLDLQRKAGLSNSSVDQQYAYAKRVTARLLRSAGEVICSYPERSGEEGLRPSPFLDGMAAAELPPEVEVHSPVALEDLLDDVAPPLGPDRFVKGGMSVIADQSACAFRAFAKHRLGARALDEVEPGLTDRERGNVTHVALELIWGSLKSQKGLMESGVVELRDLAESSVRQALDSKLGEGSRSLTRIQALEVKRLSDLLLEWLAFERRRPEFETRQLELKKRFAIGGLEIDIRADRVDRYADGSHAILDYKTGTTFRPKHWETERPEAPQLPLYSIMMDEKVSTVAFAQVAAGDLRFHGTSTCGDSGLKDGKGFTLPEQIEGWRGVLKTLATAFAEGDASVNPVEKACEFCDLMGLCRVAESVDE